MPPGLRYGVEVRRAVAADGAELARLLSLLASPVSPADAAARLDAMRIHPASVVLVATGYGGLSGLAALHWAPGLLRPHPAATLDTLVVDPDERRHGIGRLLLKAASQAARAAGCDVLAVAAGEGAMAAFCRATGFAEAGKVFERSLRRRGGDG